MAVRKLFRSKIEMLHVWVCNHPGYPLVAFDCTEKMVWVKVPFGGDLNLDRGLLLCKFILSNGVSICMDSKVHIAPLDMP